MLTLPTRLERTARPALDLIDLALAKAQIRVDHDDEDFLIGSLHLPAAIESVERMLGRALVAGPHRATFGGFGCAMALLPDVREVTAVHYLDEAGAEQTAEAGAWRVVRGPVDYLQLVDGAEWPATARHPQPVWVEFDAGFGDPEDVPAPIRIAVLLILANLFQHRQAVADDGAKLEDLAAAPRDLLLPYQVRRLL